MTDIFPISQDMNVLSIMLTHNAKYFHINVIFTGNGLNEGFLSRTKLTAASSGFI